MNATSQVLIIDTISGPNEILAPLGWEFDKTASVVWYRLLWETRSLQIASENPRLPKKYLAAMGSRIDALAQVLASSLGMATFYWTEAAKEYV